MWFARSLTTPLNYLLSRTSVPCEVRSCFTDALVRLGKAAQSCRLSRGYRDGVSLILNLKCAFIFIPFLISLYIEFIGIPLFIVVPPYLVCILLYFIFSIQLPLWDKIFFLIESLQSSQQYHIYQKVLYRQSAALHSPSTHSTFLFITQTGSQTDSDEQLVSISREPPPGSLCLHLSAEEDGFREQRPSSLRRPVLAGPKPGNQTNRNRSHQENGQRDSEAEIRAFIRVWYF